MKKIVIVFALFFLSFVAKSQNFDQFTYVELDSLMMVYYEEGAYEKGLVLTNYAFNKSKEEFGRDTLYAQYTAWGGFFYESLGEYREALFLYQETVAIFKEKLGDRNPEYAVALNNLANVHYKLGEYTEAERLYYEELAAKERIYGKEDPNYAICLNDLGVLYLELELYSKAIEMHLEALRIRGEALGKTDVSYANSLNNLAVVYQEMDQFDKAEPLMLQALAIDKKELGKDDPNYAVPLHNLATFYVGLEEYEAAESLYLEALALLERTLGKKHPYYAMPLNNLAAVYSKTGNFEKAESLYLESIEIRKNVYGTQHLNYLQSLNNLALLYKNEKLYDKAEEIYLEVISITKGIGRTESSSYVLLLNNLATLYSMSKREDKALLLYQESLLIHERNYGKQHPLYLKVLNNLSTVSLKLRKDNLARVCIQDALFVSTNQRFSLNITTAWVDSILNVDWQSLTYLERTIITIENIDNLLTRSKDASFVKERLMLNALSIQLLQKIKNSHSNSKDKLRTLDKVNYWVLRSLKLLDKTKDIEKAFEAAEYSKSILLQEAGQTKYAHRFGDLPDSLAQKENRLEKQQATLEAKLIEQRPVQEKDSLRVVLNTMNQSIKTFKKTIEKSYPSYAALKYEQKKIDTKAIQKTLDKETALIEYVLSDSVIYIFYIDQTQTELFSYSIDKKELQYKIRVFRQVLSDYDLLSKKPDLSYEQYTSLGHWFYSTLVAPALENKSLKNLIFVTDGTLGYLPFESFLVEPAPFLKGQGKKLAINYKDLHYLLKDYSISYNYSAGLFWENQQVSNKKNNHEILGMASNYKIEIDSNQQNTRLPIYQRLRKSLDPLPAAIQEVQLISNTYKGYFAFDNTANERNFKEKAPNYAVIHLAMHGLLDNRAPILSSLAFTENGDSLENNFLQAYEISKLKLNADLVVLSACETGFGKFEQGDGMASLARAFMYAGASSLVVSLWQVNDYATAQIMQNMYRHLSDGMDKAGALRQAKLDYMKTAKKEFTHPAFWSPFIQIGNSQAIVLTKKINYWFWGIGLSLIVLLGFGFWKKRQAKLKE
jgi:CHAT domain-containing protein/tetratricopeptide (TPR) repeat protein